MTESIAVYDSLVRDYDLRNAPLESLFVTQAAVQDELDRREAEAQSKAKNASDEYTALLHRLGKNPM